MRRRGVVRFECVEISGLREEGSVDPLKEKEKKTLTLTSQTASIFSLVSIQVSYMIGLFGAGASLRLDAQVDGGKRGRLGLDGS